MIDKKTFKNSLKIDILLHIQTIETAKSVINLNRLFFCFIKILL